MADGNVAVATQLTLFHVAIGHTGLGEHGHERTQERFGLGGRTEVRFGDDLKERHARAVVVDQGAAAGVAELTHVLFEMGVVDADALMLAHHVAGRTRELDFDGATDDDREVLLRELVVLRVIRVEIILPIPRAAGGDVGADHQAEQDGFLDCLTVHDW